MTRSDLVVRRIQFMHLTADEAVRALTAVSEIFPGAITAELDLIDRVRVQVREASSLRLVPPTSADVGDE